MRRLVVSALFLLVMLLSGSAALACGDKLLALGRGVRFQRIYAARQANLVIYSAGTQNGAALDSARLRTALKRTVRNLELASDGSQLDQTLKSGQVDVVLVYFADLAAIARQLQSAPSRPIILPVLIKPSRAEFAAAQSQYKFALKAAADELEFLTAIDEAMKAKLKPKVKS
jgi:ABC-type amino acid transport substrate-binding protein